MKRDPHNLLREKAALFGRATKAPPEWVYITEGECGGPIADLVLPYPSFEHMKNHSQQTVRIKYADLVKKPIQESLF